MANRNGEKHFHGEGIEIMFRSYGEEFFVGAISDYPEKEDFLEDVKELYDEKLNADDVTTTFVAWRADYMFIELYGAPCGWMEVEKGARGSFPCWKARRKYNG